MNTTSRHAALRVLALACLCVSLILIISAYAGQTVITTSDSAPTYGTASNEVVIPPDQTVTLKTTWTVGGVSPITYTCTPSGGLVMMPSYPTSTSTSEVAMFSVTSTGFGTVNDIGLKIIRTGVAANCSKSSGNMPTFVVCVPQVTEALAIGFFDLNNFYGYQFETVQTISGCDDFKQIEAEQDINSSTYRTTFTGTPTQVPNSSNSPVANTGGAFTADVFSNDSGTFPATWLSPATASYIVVSGSIATANDVHSWMPPPYTIGIGSGIPPPQYYYIQIMSKNAQFNERIRRTTGMTELTASECTWGYVWNNTNCTWTGATSPSLAAWTSAESNIGNTGYTSSAFGSTDQSPQGQYISTTGIPTP